MLAKRKTTKYSAWDKISSRSTQAFNAIVELSQVANRLSILSRSEELPPLMADISCRPAWAKGCRVHLAYPNYARGYAARWNRSGWSQEAVSLARGSRTSAPFEPRCWSRWMSICGDVSRCSKCFNGNFGFSWTKQTSRRSDRGALHDQSWSDRQDLCHFIHVTFISCLHRPACWV